MTTAIIETEGLTKRFGKRNAVNDVDLSVPAGTCFGFLGPNGAGKTTMIRMLLSLAGPTSGRATVRGVDVVAHPRTALQRVGGIVEEPRFYPYMTGRQNLEAWAALVGAGARERIPALLDRAGLSARGDERASTYSLGMRQRLAVARALLSDPELLILDEPSNGLDPAGMAEFRTMIRALVEVEHRTVFISSHLLDEVQRICDAVAIVNHGTVVVQGSMRELIGGGETGVEVDCDDPGRATQVLRGVPGVTDVRPRPDGRLLAVGATSREASIGITNALVHAGVGVAQVRLFEESLEQRYLEITEGATPSDVGVAG
ncbi:MAG: ABC transporter ATP-binding protein [Thermoleophilia bacterium]